MIITLHHSVVSRKSYVHVISFVTSAKIEEGAGTVDSAKRENAWIIRADSAICALPLGTVNRSCAFFNLRTGKRMISYVAFPRHNDDNP